ncbi:response regulator [Rhodobacter capsulatus]|uniref:response regulator n=1 Tax=Rhodobacter capsulatus TaxID=1061 RepID=UPI0040386CFE
MGGEMAHPLRMASGQAGDLCAPLPRCGLVIDDHPMIHLGCRQMLADAGFDEILTASSAEEGLALARSRQPDLAVLDLNLPEAGGMESIAPLLRACPGLRILVFTMNDRPAFAARVLEQGAHGFLSKNAPPASFRAAVAAITRGEVWLDHDTAMRLVTRRGLTAESPLAGLTPRERTVLFRLGGRARPDADRHRAERQLQDGGQHQRGPEKETGGARPERPHPHRHRERRGAGAVRCHQVVPPFDGGGAVACGLRS